MDTKIDTSPYKGARDFYPAEMLRHEWMFSQMQRVVRLYGYEPYNGPMIEPFAVYAAKSGSELVNEQLYHFIDRGDRKVAIRPEMTPTLARMVAAKSQEITKPIRWYSTPNLWRYERPQRGRLREHWQLNVDLIGVNTEAAEVEVIQIADQIMRNFGAKAGDYCIRINNRMLMDHIFYDVMQLTREQVPPVARLLDKREKIDPAGFVKNLENEGLGAGQIDVLLELPTLQLADLEKKYPTAQGTQALVKLFERLAQVGVLDSCVLNLGVMRGLDYYTGTVFEMFDGHPDNNRALFGGGRYDKLVSLFGGEPLSGVGFGMGDVTILHFLQTHQLLPNLSPVTQVLLCVMDDAGIYAESIAGQLRQQGINVEHYLPEGDKLKKQLKMAHKKDLPFAIIIGSAEVAEQKITLKNLKTGEQQCLPYAGVREILLKTFSP